MKNPLLSCLSIALTITLAVFPASSFSNTATAAAKWRVIVTSDGEVDDECSMVRFLLYANEWDIEGIITSSSQYHWQGHRWAGDKWAHPILNAYAKVHKNLIKHDPGYPTPEYLHARTLLGNVKSEGDMDAPSPGSQHIVKVLLDESDDRPIWLQAWGGTNTIARALKTIEEKYPTKMAYVANKIRFFFIWEQDPSYQAYIRPQWGKYNILTIISDQFWAIAYQWNKIQPPAMQKYFSAPWMKNNILNHHGALCSIYKAHKKGSYGLAGDYDFAVGDFRSEGDSPAFLHIINTGLRNAESPHWGGWGGRYINVRNNTWLDPVPVEGYRYPTGRWYTGSAWGRNSMRDGTNTTAQQRLEYFKPIWRWSKVLQNDFAARADWSVASYEDANHPPEVALGHARNLTARPGKKITLSAKGTRDPDGDRLHYRWWHYREAGSYTGDIKLTHHKQTDTFFIVPKDAKSGATIHIVVEVTDSGTPSLTRYQRVIVEVK